MAFLPSLSPTDLRHYHRVVTYYMQVRSQFDVLVWLQGDMQHYLPHDIMIAAWGNFSDGAIQHDIISTLPGVRSKNSNPETLPPLLFHLFERWTELGNRPLSLNSGESGFLLSNTGLNCALGHALFNRQRRGVELTAAGHALHKAVSTGLHEIGASIEKLRGKPTTKVRVSTTVAFAGRWLLPRLLEFQSLHPEIDIEMIETDECLDLHKSGIDFAIRYGKGKWKHHRSTLLFEERFFPVCSPGYLEAVGHRRVQDFDDVTVFHLAGAAHAWEDWPTWFDLSERSPAGKVRGGHTHSHIAACPAKTRDGVETHRSTPVARNAQNTTPGVVDLRPGGCREMPMQDPGQAPDRLGVRCAIGVKA